MMGGGRKGRDRLARKPEWETQPPKESIHTSFQSPRAGGSSLKITARNAAWLPSGSRVIAGRGENKKLNKVGQM